MKYVLPVLFLFLQGCQEEAAPISISPPPKIEAKEPTPEPQKPQDPRYRPQRLHQLAELETKKMVVNGHTLTVWIMDNNSKRAEGMMWLEDRDVKDTEGMLFVFKEASPQSFWMQNCPLGLDICYIDPKGKVLNVGEGKPFDESGVPSKGAAQYVLELKVGRAKKFGIKAGTVLSLPKDVKAKE